jgi:general secretion pathway protein C
MQKLMNRLGTAATLVLVVVLADRLAAFSWALLRPASAPAGPAPLVSAPGAAPGEPAALDYETIAGLHLFGVIPPEPVPTAAPKPRPVVTEVPETRLKLTLKGIYHHADPENARAIIAGPGVDEEVYAVGELLPGDATLEGIEPRRVVLAIRGNLEALTFPELSDTSILGEAPLEPAAPAGAARRINASRLASRYLDRIQSDPSALTEIAQAEPVMDQGQLQGFRLSPGRQPSLLRQLGLRPGDVITEVNGVPLTDATGALGSLGELSAATELQITVLRSGRRIPYSFRLR